MVNLSTTYDTEIHKKVFVLKGEEGYARTTDVVASLVEFADTDNYITNARYGLKIQVLRNIGDSSIAVYDNDELVKLNDGSTLTNINWYESMSQATCPSGCTWDDTDSSLTIGLEVDDDDPTDAYLQTGLALNYDVEHNIVVRYMGNSSCMKSTSDNINKTIEFPSAFVTKFTLEAVGSTSNVYTHNQTPVIKGTLTDGNDLPLQSVSVKVYEDGVLVATHNTGDDGSYSYTTSGLDSGLHTYRFVFDGVDNQYYACNNSVDISYGYDMDVTYDPTWLMGKGSIYVTVSDFFGNPVNEEYVSCHLGGTTLTGVTEGGTATLTNNTTNYQIYTPLTVTTGGGDVSDSFSPVIGIPDTCEFDEGYLEACDGSSGIVRVTATAVDMNGYPISVQGCSVSLTNLDDTTATLSVDGEAFVDYTPSGAGNVNITATFGDVTATAVLEDFMFYWYVGYMNHKALTSGCTLSEVSNGYRIRNYSSDDGFVKFSNYLENRYNQLEFKVVSNNMEYVRFNSSHNISVVAGDVIKVVNDSTSRRYYVNDELVSEVSSAIRPILTIRPSQVMVIDNLKLRYIN